MEHRVREFISRLSREDLEAFAMRTVLQLKLHAREGESRRIYAAVMLGFMLGASVAAAGFLTGVSLG